MSLTARHKKPGGFRKLVNSLETTPPAKRDLIVEAMRKEDPDFTAEVERCIFKFEEFTEINDLVIAEVIGALHNEMRTVAIALYNSPNKALVEKFTKNMMPAQAVGYRDELSMLDKVTLGEQTGARFRIILKAREFEADGKFLLKKYSPNYLDG